MRMHIKENVNKGVYKGFIYQRASDEIGIDYHALDPETEKPVGRTMQICMYLNKSEQLQFLNKEKTTNEARMDQDCINENANIEAGWKGYKKGIEKALEIIKGNQAIFTLRPIKDSVNMLLIELEQADLMLTKEKSLEAIPADENAKLINTEKDIFQIE